MSEIVAKPVIKNECWIVESDGRKVAAILGSPMGVTLVAGKKRERFPDLKNLSKKYNIKVGKATSKKQVTKDTDVYGYPCSTARAHNVLWDVQKKLPIFTKTAKSKSFFCAGHYLIKLDDSTWTHQFCPKTIILGRHEFIGPYKSEEEAKCQSN